MNGSRRIPAQRFDTEITINHHNGHGPHKHVVRVTGTREAAHTAGRRGHPDNWTPAEGGEIEIEAIYIQAHGRERRLPPALADHYAEEIGETLEARIE